MAVWLVTLGDTLLVKQVPVPPSGFQMVTGVASGIVSIVICLVILAAVPLALAIRAQVQKTGASLAKMQSDLAPLLRDSQALVADLRAIATSVRADAATVHQAVSDADAGLRAVARRAEMRLAEVDAMVGIVQDEIQDVFVATAAVARGVRAGAEALGHGLNGAAGANDDLSETGATEYGGHSEREAEPGRARPRIRSRGAAS